MATVVLEPGQSNYTIANKCEEVRAAEDFEGGAALALLPGVTGVTVESTLAEHSTFTLPADADYRYSPDIESRRLDILDAQGATVITLPLVEEAGEWVSPPVSHGAETIPERYRTS